MEPKHEPYQTTTEKLLAAQQEISSLRSEVKRQQVLVRVEKNRGDEWKRRFKAYYLHGDKLKTEIAKWFEEE